MIFNRGVVDARITTRISGSRAAALIAHGLGRLRLGQLRLDLLVTLWTLSRPRSSSLASGFIALSYLMPWARVAWHGHVAKVADQYAERFASTPPPLLTARVSRGEPRRCRTTLRVRP